MKWRDITADAIGSQPSIDRLVRFLGRRLPGIRFEDDASAAQFAERMPALLQRTWEHVGEERVREYLHDARQRAQRSMKEYLS